MTTKATTTCRPTSAPRSPQQTLSLSVDNGQLLLGTWQAVYLWEHRSAPHRRTIACHLIGEMQTTKRAVADTSTNLQRRNGEKLNELVQAKHTPEAWAEGRRRGYRGGSADRPPA